jgi:hypothetical protein
MGRKLTLSGGAFRITQMFLVLTVFIVLPYQYYGGEMC